MKKKTRKLIEQTEQNCEYNYLKISIVLAIVFLKLAIQMGGPTLHEKKQTQIHYSPKVWTAWFSYKLAFFSVLENILSNFRKT